MKGVKGDGDFEPGGSKEELLESLRLLEREGGRKVKSRV